MKITSINSKLMEYMDILEELHERVFGGLRHLKPEEREYYTATRKQLAALWDYSQEAFISRMSEEALFDVPMIRFWLREKWPDGRHLCSIDELFTIYAWYLFTQAENVKKKFRN